MTVTRIVTTVIFCLMLYAPVLAGPEGSVSSVVDPRLLGLNPADDLFATADLAALLDSSQNATQHYGPYPSDSPDSGTCGNSWATDTFDRHFTVRTNQDGTFLVIQQFKKGSFVTAAGPSPGACDNTDGSPPGTVDAGEDRPDARLLRHSPSTRDHADLDGLLLRGGHADGAMHHDGLHQQPFHSVLPGDLPGDHALLPLQRGRSDARRARVEERFG